MYKVLMRVKISNEFSNFEADEFKSIERIELLIESILSTALVEELKLVRFDKVEASLIHPSDGAQTLIAKFARPARV